jgi:hypothetical protein
MSEEGVVQFRARGRGVRAATAGRLGAAGPAVSVVEPGEAGAPIRASVDSPQSAP